MRNMILNQAIRMMMIGSAALMLPSCGHDDASNNSSGGGGGGGGSGSDGSQSGASNADFGDNDMDSNVAQMDPANSTTADGKAAKSGGSGAM